MWPGWLHLCWLLALTVYQWTGCKEAMMEYVPQHSSFLITTQCCSCELQFKWFSFPQITNGLWRCGFANFAWRDLISDLLSTIQKVAYSPVKWFYQWFGWQFLYNGLTVSPSQPYKPFLRLVLMTNDFGMIVREESYTPESAKVSFLGFIFWTDKTSLQNLDSINSTEAHRGPTMVGGFHGDS